MKKKMKIGTRLILILILIILFIKIYFLIGLSKNNIIDDSLFIKLLSNRALDKKDSQIIKNRNEDEKEYKFTINYKNIDFKSIDLSKTIDKETLVYEKIAPGTSGSFNILINSNQNFKYRIEFSSMNEKPKNLNFKALKNEKILGESNTLEELSEKLTGYINKNEEINITIKWYWNFENEQDEKTDIQDTRDSENIRKYQFNIYALGEELI